jgi:hypothetical protein
MADPSVIGKLYSRLASKVKELDERLIQEFEPAISNIDQLRFEAFKKCIAEKNESAACYHESEKMELRPNLEKAGRALEECVNKAASSSGWEKAGDGCLLAYEQSLRKDL